MRQRASELATQWLGPRSEREIKQGLAREIKQDRWTSLDGSLLRQTKEGVIDLRHVPQTVRQENQRGALLGRLDHLSKLGLAEKHKSGIWMIAPQTEQTLRAMGERGDIVRMTQRALGKQPREYMMWDVSRNASPIVGRVIGKGLSDELTDRGYLIVDGKDGGAHYVRLPASADLADYQLGGYVKVRSHTPVKVENDISLP